MKQIRPIEAAHKYKSLTSLNGTEYELLLSVFDKSVKEKQKHYTLKGQRRVRIVHQEQRIVYMEVDKN